MPPIYVFTDGAASRNGTPACKAAWAIFFSRGDARNKCAPVETNPSNQKAELCAILQALRSTEDEEDVTIITDSQYCIDSITKWSRAWERNDWKTSKGLPVKHMPEMKECLRIYRKLSQDFENQRPRVKFRHVNSHRTPPSDVNGEDYFLWDGNAQADTLASSVLR